MPPTARCSTRSRPRRRRSTAMGSCRRIPSPTLNYLVSSSMAEHRKRREEALAMLAARSVDPPLPAAGYQLPIEVDNPTDAANLAVRMEEDAAVAWRAVVEQATDEQERAFAVSALTDCAVRAARWSRVLGTTPITVAFPGGKNSRHPTLAICVTPWRKIGSRMAVALRKSRLLVPRWRTPRRCLRPHSQRGFPASRR